jgi:hypothetical protein
MSGRIEVGGISVICERVSHPLLGDAHIIEHAGAPITALTAIDWDRPTQIPAIAAPGTLPPSAGGALLNELARRATQPLRYAGPYPTPGLYRALLRSFRASADEATFTKDLLQRAATLARDEIAVDFTPAPHARVANPHGHAEVRDGVERVVVDGIAYEPTGSPARVVPAGRSESGPLHARGLHAEVWFGDEPWARVATFDAAGALVNGPHAIPRADSKVLGTAFPPALLSALSSLVAELVPLALPVELRAVTWADLGARAARRTDRGYEVHVALWERLAPHGMARLALGLAEALAPVVTLDLVRQLQEGSLG